jgi:hypothetical protein
MFTPKKGVAVLANTPLGARRKAERIYYREGKAISVDPIPQDSDWTNED